MFVIESQSGVNRFRNCIIGKGTTETEAWEDAIGPKPWTTYQKSVAKKAWIREVAEDELD